MTITTSLPTLRELRHRRRLTLDAVHVLTDGEVDVATISRVERGIGETRPRTIVHLARAYGVSAKRMKEIIGRSADAALSKDSA
jgi:transcriptional regulator with XRE-family HTH domain